MISLRLKKGLDAIVNPLRVFDKVVFISEVSDWVVKEVCRSIQYHINKRNNVRVGLSTTHYLLKNKVLHFGSVNTLVGENGFKKINPSNRSVLSWFHVVEGNPRLNYLMGLSKKIDLLHTSCELSKKALIKNDFPQDKIRVIPIGIDLLSFLSYSSDKKEKIKQKLRIPTDKKIIGSFQKDGIGWKDGLEPKLIKGPDVFCNVIEQVAKSVPVHVLLTGPARGYVKQRLDKAGIGYTHHFLQDYLDIVDYYNVLDAYVIASRVEGGPKAMMESWACRVPLITTSVGMCADWVKDGYNGFLAQIEDVDGLAKQLERVLTDNVDDLGSILDNAQNDVKQFDWPLIADQYLNKLYLPLLK